MARSLPENPEVVCLCGSTSFMDTYLDENERLTREGKIVLSVGVFYHSDDVKLSDDEKSMLDELHKRKIDISDRIHVLNVNGHIGASTKSEIEYAKRLGIEITYLNE